MARFSVLARVLPLFLGRLVIETPGRSDRPALRVACPAGSLELGIGIEKCLEHEGYEISHPLSCTVGLCVKLGVVTKARLESRR
jgi:hypothetical protein